MQNGRFAVPPPSLDRAMVPYDLPTGKYLNAGTLQGAQYLSCSWSMTASSSSLASSVDISPMSAPLRSSDTELHSSGKKNQKKSWRLWKLFSRKNKADNSHSQNPPKSLTASDTVPLKKHKSTPDLKESRLNINANSLCHDSPPPLPIAPSATSFVRTSSGKDTTIHPTIILVISDDWNTSSVDFPLQRVTQPIPVDVTDEETLEEYSSHPNTHLQRTHIQYHPVRGQRQQAQTNNSRWLKTYTHDPNVSFMDIETKSNTFRRI